MPPRHKKVVSNNPLLSIITYDSMFSVRSPHDGYMSSFNRTAQVTPDRLSPDDVVMTLSLVAPPEPEISRNSTYDQLLRQMQAREAAQAQAATVTPRRRINTGAAIQGAATWVPMAAGNLNWAQSVEIEPAPPAPRRYDTDDTPEQSEVRRYLLDQHRTINTSLVREAAQVAVRGLEGRELGNSDRIRLRELNRFLNGTF